MDWKKKIEFLRANGFTQQQIADYVGCSQSYIGLIATGSRGKNLSFSIAKKIIELVESVSQKVKAE